MAEYIDKEALRGLIEKWRDVRTTKYTARDAIVINAILYAVNMQPVADVAPVVPGKWETVPGSNGKAYMVCTNCRKQQPLSGVFSYCPNCGARMDGDDDG